MSDPPMPWLGDRGGVFYFCMPTPFHSVTSCRNPKGEAGVDRHRLLSGEKGISEADGRGLQAQDERGFGSAREGHHVHVIFTTVTFYALYPGGLDSSRPTIW